MHFIQHQDSDWAQISCQSVQKPNCSWRNQSQIEDKEISAKLQCPGAKNVYTHHGPSSAKSQAEEVRRIDRGWTKEDGRSKSSEMKKMQEANTYTKRKKRENSIFLWSLIGPAQLRQRWDTQWTLGAGRRQACFWGPRKAFFFEPRRRPTKGARAARKIKRKEEFVGRSEWSKFRGPKKKKKKK